MNCKHFRFAHLNLKINFKIRTKQNLRTFSFGELVLHIKYTFLYASENPNCAITLKQLKDF